MPRDKDWCTLIPVEPRFQGFAAVVGSGAKVGVDVTLRPIPSWVRGLESECFLSWSDDQFFKSASFALVVPYRANSLGNPTPTGSVDPVSGRPHSNEHQNVQQAQLALLALWLANPTPLLYGPVVHAEYDAGSWGSRCWGSCLQLYYTIGDWGPSMNAGDLASADRIANGLADIAHHQGDTGLWLAIRSLYVGLSTAGEWRMRYAADWIAMEALFGPRNGLQLRRRISQRGGAFLAEPGDDPAGLTQAIRKAYDWRCKAIHGAISRKPADPRALSQHRIELLDQVEGWLRSTILRIIADPELIRTFASADREEYLSGLEPSGDARGCLMALFPKKRKSP